MRQLKWYNPYRYVDPGYRAYLRDHPIAFWLSFGIACFGFTALAFPDTILHTTVSKSTPHWLHTAYYVLYFIGGLTATIGVFFGKVKLEAAGMILVASGLCVDFLTIADMRPQTLPQESIRLALAIGTFRRAQWLIQNHDAVMTLICWEDGQVVEHGKLGEDQSPDSEHE